MNNVKNTAEALAALTVPCPVCCARPGERCMNPLGDRYTRHPHRERVKRANAEEARVRD